MIAAISKPLSGIKKWLDSRDPVARNYDPEEHRQMLVEAALGDLRIAKAQREYDAAKENVRLAALCLELIDDRIGY